MAILKDTTILGDARVTDTLYANELNGATLRTDHLALNTNSNATSVEQNQLEFLSSSDVSYAKVVANISGMLGLFSKRIIGVFPGDNHSAGVSVGATNEYQNADGLYLYTDMVKPIKTNTMSLGDSDTKWANIYSTTATLNGLSVVGGDIVMSEASGHGATHKLIFQRGTAADQYTDWKLYNDSTGILTLQSYHNGLDADTDILQVLCPTTSQTPALVPGTTNSYDIGSSSLVWRHIYATTLHGALTLAEITGASDLQAIEALEGTSGILRKTAADTWSLDTGTYVLTDDSRLSDARTPTSHAHGIIANDGSLVNPSNDNILANRIPYSNASGSLTTTAKLTFDGSMLYSQANATSYNSGGAANTNYGLNIVNGTTVLGHIGHNGNNLILYNCAENATMSDPAIIFRNKLNDTSNGIRMNDTELGPITTTLSSALTLGSTTNKWKNVYAGLITPDSATYSTSTTAGIVYYNGSTLSGHIGLSTGGAAPGSLGFQSVSTLVFRAGATEGNNNILDGVYGMDLSSTGLAPKTNAAALDTTGALNLGASTLQWATTYSKQYVVDAHVTLAYDSTDKSLNFNFA